MTNKAGIIGVVLLLVLVVGCSQLGTKSPAQLSEEYTAKAQKLEAQGDLVEALEQYKLVLTVDPENQLAKEKSTTINQELHNLAEEHYQTGRAFYNKGQYAPARKEFLTALRYYPEHAKAKNKLTATRKVIEPVKRYIVHTLQPDESISTLAERYYGDYRKFHLIAEYNELEDATRVTVGQEIKIPVIPGIPIIADPAAIQTDTGETPESMPGDIITVKSFVIHTVQPGESLSKLAQMYYGDYNKFDVITQFNGLEDGISVRVGQEIKIPEIEGVPFLTEGKVEETEVSKIPEKLPAAEEETIEKPEEAFDKKQITTEDQTVNYREFGIELFKSKEYADAITEFHKVLNAHPDDKIALNYMSLAYFEKGLILFGKEEYLGARDEFKAALQYNIECDKCDQNIQKCENIYKEIHYDKGMAYFGDQKLADAIGEWKLVYELDPDYKDVNKNLKKAGTLFERLESIKRSKKQKNKQ